MHITEHLTQRTKPLISLEITPPVKGHLNIFRMNMKQILLLVLVPALISEVNAQYDSTSINQLHQNKAQQTKSYPYPFPGILFWKSGASVNRYSNFKTGETVEYSVFETNLYSIATITSKNRITRISSNYPVVMIPLIISALGMGNRDLALVSLLPEIVGNAKIYLPIFTDHFRVGCGLNTDYYLFYKNSVIYSEAVVGVKITIKKFRLYGEYRYPLNSSYLDNNKHYFGINIGLFEWENNE